MTGGNDTFASAKTRDLLAGLDMHVSGESYSMTLDGIEPDVPEEAAALNDAEANNLSFIVSARFSRMDSCMTALESDSTDTNYAQLAEKVAGRLEELAKRVSPPSD